MPDRPSDTRVELGGSESVLSPEEREKAVEETQYFNEDDTTEAQTESEPS